ncbi:MAG: LapA family protein [Candidatus Omnitrophica bacterium]|nr:LapA family protein [Candidatus Omnitrophota bacterium]
MKPKHIAILVVSGFCLIVLLQNTQVVSFNLFFWKLSMSRIILFPLLIVIGFLIGFFVGRKSLSNG